MDGLSDEEQGRLNEVLRLFYSDSVVEAYQQLLALESALSPEKVEILNGVEEVSVLKFEIAECNKALEMLGDYSSWTLRGETEHAATFSKSVHNQFYVRSEVIVESPIFPVLAVFSETDLLSTWIDLLNSSDEIARPSPFRRIVHFRMNIPWPVKNRDVLLAATGVPVPQNRSVLLVLRDLTGFTSYLGFPIPPQEPDYVRMTVDFSCANMMYKSEEESQISIIFQGNPHIHLIPDNIMSYCTSKVMLMFISSVREECLKFKGSQYEQRVAQNTAYYDAIKEQATKYRVELNLDQ